MKSGTHQDWLLEKVSPEPNSGCWLWTGGCYSNKRCGKAQRRRPPYGKFSIGKKTLTAHRAAFILLVGPINDNQVVCHECDNPYCVNPAHLFLGSHAENSADMKRKGRSYKPALGEKAKVLSIEDARALRARALEGENQQRLADEFGVSQTMVSRIKLGKAWSKAA